MKNLQNKSKYFKINQNFHFSRIPCILDGEKIKIVQKKLKILKKVKKI